MLHLALMSSENRSAHAVCRYYPGGLPACVRAMNDKAAALGMTTARFVEPTGLSSENVASPTDLATLVLAAAADQTIRSYSTDAEHTVYINRQPFEYRNTNRLVQNSAWQVDIQKTGYISKAGRCLVHADGDRRPPRGHRAAHIRGGKLTRIADAQRIRAWLEAQSRSVATRRDAAAQPFG